MRLTLRGWTVAAVITGAALGLCNPLWAALPWAV